MRNGDEARAKRAWKAGDKVRAKTVFGIAKIVTECYGHGSYGSEEHICKEGEFGSGQFPPIFTKRKDAEKFVALLERWAKYKVVELELRRGRAP